MIEPKEVIIDDRSFILTKFPSIPGREIVALYPTSAMPKVGDYKVNEATMLKLMSYVYVQIGDNKVPLNTEALVNNHTGNWETLGKVEIAMMEYNCSFFQNGRISTFFEDIAQKLPEWISKMWMALSEQLSRQAKPPSTS